MVNDDLIGFSKTQQWAGFELGSSEWDSDELSISKTWLQFLGTGCSRIRNDDREEHSFNSNEQTIFVHIALYPVYK